MLFHEPTPYNRGLCLARLRALVAHRSKVPEKTAAPPQRDFARQLGQHTTAQHIPSRCGHASHAAAIPLRGPALWCNLCVCVWGRGGGNGQCERVNSVCRAGLCPPCHTAVSLGRSHTARWRRCAAAQPDTFVQDRAPEEEKEEEEEEEEEQEGKGE
ncbi:unnamed protein product [Prorocentrum cordatum]|uniref:Uncharacterized protein n=1 Tax=Prorocentrum cordatum TaxID=2364126 RepID=A0ABN9VPC1_9DINO|nr:unnamed protein product [Polarella glacialis]